MVTTIGNTTSPDEDMRNVYTECENMRNAYTECVLRCVLYDLLYFRIVYSLLATPFERQLDVVCLSDFGAKNRDALGHR